MYTCFGCTCRPAFFMKIAPQFGMQSGSNSAKTSRFLIATWHFVLAVIALGALVWSWREVRSEDDRAFLGTISWVIIPMAALYVSAGWGILKWKNWGRILGLALNWINVLAAVVRIARLGIEGGISVLASGLALWWLSTPAVKLMFRDQTKLK